LARFVYAKIYCDILRHPLLRGRPDCDVRLVLGLLLEAKEHTDDGVLRHLTAVDAKELCHIKAPTAKVQAGIDYLVAAGWLIPHPDLAYEIKDFVERQGKTDSPEAQAERSQRYYESHRETILAKRKVSRENARETVRSSHAEEEEEEEGEEEQDPPPSPKAATPAPPIADLESDWPSDLLARVRLAVMSTRKSGQMAEGPWREFLLGAKQFSPEIRARAANEYLDRACASEGKGERYLLGIMRGERTRVARPGAATLQITPAAKADHAIPGRKFL